MKQISSAFTTSNTPTKPLFFSSEPTTLNLILILKKLRALIKYHPTQIN